MDILPKQVAMKKTAPNTSWMHCKMALLIAESQLRYEIGRGISEVELHPIQFEFVTCTELTTRG